TGRSSFVIRGPRTVWRRHPGECQTAQAKTGDVVNALGKRSRGNTRKGAGSVSAVRYQRNSRLQLRSCQMESAKFIRKDNLTLVMESQPFVPRRRHESHLAE